MIVCEAGFDAITYNAFSGRKRAAGSGPKTPGATADLQPGSRVEAASFSGDLDRRIAANSQRSLAGLAGDFPIVQLRAECQWLL